MYDADTQARFNKSCTEAVVNYLNASGAAYQAVADNMLMMWGQSVDAFVEGVQNSRRGQEVLFFQPARPSQSGVFDCMMPWAAVPKAMMENVNPLAAFSPFGSMPDARYGVFSLFAPWMEMMMPKNATAWPMAVGMISVGVPENVAWPTARGNAAAMDAFGLAAKSVEKAFQAYGAKPAANKEPDYSRIEETPPHPLTVMFAVMPLNPAQLMQFFMPFRPR